VNPSPTGSGLSPLTTWLARNATLLADAHYQLARQFQEAGQLPEAQAEYERALEIAPDGQDAQDGLAEVVALLTPPTPTPTPVPSPPAQTGKRIEINLTEQHLYVWEGDQLVYDWVCSTGGYGSPTVPGNYQVLDKIPNAYASTWDLQMPYWLGIYYAGTLENGIHALPILSNGQRLWEGYLGQRVSYGCVILSTEAARTLYRETYKERLAELQGDLLEMGKLVDQAIALSIQALANRDAALARRIIDGDVQINMALRSDLRTILSVSNIATEMERMGDYAKGIAQITLDMADQPLLKPLIDVPRMANKGRQLLRDQLDAFIRRDVDAARRLSAEDDEIDALYDQVYRELLIFMMEDPRTVSRATRLLWVAHNLERIGDRTTNIGERTIFLVTGQIEELNP